MNNIKKYRIEQGMVQEELAQKAGISVGYLCHLERETRKNPSISVMENIAKVLNKSVAELFFPENINSIVET